MNFNIYTFKGVRLVVGMPKLLLFALTFLVFHNPGNSQNCQRSIHRSIDGTCNNLGINTSNWGAANIPVHREMRAHYSSTNPFGGMISHRPNPRKISNEVFDQGTASSNTAGLSSFVFTWGQFLDHDISISLTDRSEKADIPLPPDEPGFTVPISFNRTTRHPGTGLFSTREQTNSITSWIDASQVYGSDAHRASWLRTYRNGKMKVSAGNLLPYNTVDGQYNSAIDHDAPEMDNPVMARGPAFVAGDIRAAEQPGLTTLHTLFIREHNRICDELMAFGYHQDELIYQLARKRIGATIQAITYNEFLPALGINVNTYRTYNPNVKPDVMNEFSTAAYRIGHTMVTEQLLLLNDDCSEAREALSLGEAFFNPRWVAEMGIEPFLKGLSVQYQEEIDAKIVDGLRNFLFNIPQLPGAFGLDLGALNIQRGRDHGLQDYNSMRAYFTGSRLTSFDQINSDPAVWLPLAKAYNYDINNIDAWVGMLCEEKLPGSNVGWTIHQILKIQFERVRDGDYYFYKNDPHFTPAQVNEIDAIRLSEVIKNNTPLTTLPYDVFKVDESKCQPIVEGGSVTCGEITINYGGGSITMTGLPNKTYFFQVFNKSWYKEFSCGWRCGQSQSVNDLKDGTYRVFVFDTNGTIICEQLIDLTSVIVGPIDKDGDGVIAGVDCNDNDANLTVVGATCNDGNPNTINDKVNGKCVCIGTPKPPIDNDGDGVFASVDCNDNDANLTVVGATCNDGNPNTINDKVNGKCVCIGTPKPPTGQTITCNDITITYGNGAISINGRPGVNYKYKVERVHPGWFSHENCLSNTCGSSKAYSNLSPGLYTIRIYSPDWKPLCTERFELKQSFAEGGATERTSPQAILVNNQSTSFGSALYPNPAFDQVQITLPDFVGQEGRITLYNSLGQQVKVLPTGTITEAPIMIDIQQLEAGMYQVQAIFEGQSMVNHKLVVKR